MNSTEQINLRPIWDACLSIYAEVAKVCDRHGLRYYVTDGTLIGALRHEGFIPWDDDLDISMPRPDYEKFIEYCKRELPENLKFVNWHNTPEFTQMFGKVQETREWVVHEVERASGMKMTNGVFIDIFPIDGYPSGRLGKWRTRMSYESLDQVWKFRVTNIRDHKTAFARCGWLLGALLNPFFMARRSWQDFMQGYEDLLLRYSFESSEGTGRASKLRTLLNRRPVPRNAWGTPKRVPFDHAEVNVPSEPDFYLRSVYGDYMRLPPVEKRKPTHSAGDYSPWWLGPTLND